MGRMPGGPDIWEYFTEVGKMAVELHQFFQERHPITHVTATTVSTSGGWGRDVSNNRRKVSEDARRNDADSDGINGALLAAYYFGTSIPEGSDVYGSDPVGRGSGRFHSDDSRGSGGHESGSGRDD